jgi:hypothetical protein
MGACQRFSKAGTKAVLLRWFLIRPLQPKLHFAKRVRGTQAVAFVPASFLLVDIFSLRDVRSSNNPAFAPVPDLDANGSLTISLG